MPSPAAPFDPIRDAAGRLVDWARRQLVPPRCVGCEDRLPLEHRLVCRSCRPTVRRLEGPKCPTCALPRRGVGGGRAAGIDAPCPDCRETRPDNDGADARWLYDGTIALALRRAKYGGQPWRLRRLGLALRPWLDERLARLPDASDPEPPVVVPVPMHPRDLRRRGFNAAVQLARFGFGSGGVRLSLDTVAKTERTPAQASLRRARRLENVRGVFRVRRPDRIRGRRCLLFDDIATTGATLAELARVVRAHEPAGLWVLTAARAPDQASL
jgi:predicted amidophosphoribosyltransferase